MPQYVYAINGQRHVFEGPDPQTTARFAQRWAAQEAGRAPVTVADIQQRLGQQHLGQPQPGARPSQFATDLGARVDKDVGDLSGAIDMVKAHPTSLFNGPRILDAVARYVPNALGLAPAAGVDQLTGPVVRGINRKFGSHYDPRGVTDELLDGAGLLTGAGEFVGLSRLGKERLSAFAEKLHDLDAEQPGTTLPVAPLEAPPPSPIPPKPGPDLSVAYRAPKVIKKVAGQNFIREDVVPLTDGFVHNHQQRMESLQDLPEDIQDEYHDAIADRIINPILDDPDYRGHNAATVQNIIHELATMADGQRASGGSPQLADALDAANEDFRVMVNQQQPEMAKELGLGAVGASSNAESDIDQSHPSGEFVNFDHYIPPPKEHIAPVSDVDMDFYGEDIGKYLRKVGYDYGPRRVKLILKAWKDMDLTANDNFPSPNWAGKLPPRQPINYPLAEDFDPPKPLRDTMTFPEKIAWMKTAANENGPPMPDEYLQNYLTDLWGPPERELGMGGRAQGTKLRAVWTAPQPSPTNAFSVAASGPQTLDPAEGAPAPRKVNGGLDFNALRPPRWFGPTMVGAASLPQDPRPQN